MTNLNRAAARRTGRAAVSGAARGSRAGDEPAWSPGPLPTSETRFERPAQRPARRARRRTGALGTGSHVTRPCNCELAAGRVYGVCGPEDKKNGHRAQNASQKSTGLRAIFFLLFFSLFDSCSCWHRRQFCACRHVLCTAACSALVTVQTRGLFGNRRLFLARQERPETARP